MFVNSYQDMSHYRKRYGDSFQNYSRLMKIKAMIGVSINTMTIVDWSCTARMYEKCRKSWSTGAHVISVWNSKYICPIGSVSRSKLNLESDSKMCRNGETARKNCNGMTNTLSRDFNFNTSGFCLFDGLSESHLPHWPSKKPEIEPFSWTAGIILRNSSYRQQISPTKFSYVAGLLS